MRREGLRVFQFRSSLTKQHSMRVFFLLTIGTALLLQAGCGGNGGRPADMPRLNPVRVTIIQDGKPLEGADVTLTIKTPTNYGVATGLTDASGVAVLRTYGYDGVPAGQYTVTVVKRVVEGGTQVTSPIDGSTYETGGSVYQTVDAQYTDTQSSPLSIDVTTKGATESFDVGAAVRISMGKGA